jgi:hypothetical protein
MKPVMATSIEEYACMSSSSSRRHVVVVREHEIRRLRYHAIDLTDAGPAMRHATAIAKPILMA